MPMSLQEQVRLLSMVDILGPLSPEELEELAKRVPDTYLEQGDILYTPQQGPDSTERLFILKKGRVQVYQMSQEGSEITLGCVAAVWARRVRVAPTKGTSASITRCEG